MVYVINRSAHRCGACAEDEGAEGMGRKCLAARPLHTTGRLSRLFARHTLFSSPAKMALFLWLGLHAAVNVQAEAGDWPMLGHDPQHSSHSTNPVPNNPDQKWQVRVARRFYASPAVDDQRIYVAAREKSVKALDINSGDIVWETSVDGLISATPLLAGDSVVVGDKDGVVTALNRADGKVKWTRKTGDKILSDPIIYDGTVYVGSNDLFLYALDLATGAIRWRYWAKDYKYGGLFPSPSTDGERVYIGGKNGELHAVMRSNGRPAWKAYLGSSIYGAVLVDRDRLYVGSYDRFLYALNAQDGSILWKTELDDWPQGSPVLQDHTLYIPSRTGVLYAVNAEDGSLAWQLALEEDVRHGLSLGSNGMGVIGTTEGRLMAIDLAKREIVWERFVEGGVYGSVALSRHGIVVTTLDGAVARLQ